MVKKKKKEIFEQSDQLIEQTAVVVKDLQTIAKIKKKKEYLVVLKSNVNYNITVVCGTKYIDIPPKTMIKLPYNDVVMDDIFFCNIPDTCYCKIIEK